MKKFVADGHGEAHARGRDAGVQSAPVHLPEILDAGGQGESQFLHGVAAGFMPGTAVDADRLQRGALAAAQRGSAAISR